MMPNVPIVRLPRATFGFAMATVLTLLGCDAPAAPENRATGGASPAGASPVASFDQQAAEVLAGRSTTIRAEESTLSDGRLQTLGTLTALTQLELPHAVVDDHAVRQFASLENLEVLVLGDTTISDDGWRRLTSLKKLKRLNVANCEIDDAALRDVSSWGELELLRIGSKHVTDAGLAEIAALPKLRHLIIRFAPISDAGLKPLADMKRLESLYLEGTRVTEAGERELLRARPDLHIHFP